MKVSQEATALLADDQFADGGYSHRNNKRSNNFMNDDDDEDNLADVLGGGGRANMNNVNKRVIFSNSDSSLTSSYMNEQDGEHNERQVGRRQRHIIGVWLTTMG